MTREHIDRSVRVAVIRELLNDLKAETPRSMHDAVRQQGAIEHLQGKLEELDTEVITGD
ncbi:hypothetical protein ACFW2V_12585 [Streptomyces sp. NPDC058947]|uniref:hypothetical protein n=1 Tax=Streptomyces sp. NPDC058947 TaxID=3346675 RepID=UPI0036A03BB7